MKHHQNRDKSLPVDTSAPEETVIVAENISKRYFQNESRPTLRREAIQIVKRLIGRKANTVVGEPFWAIRNVSFSVCTGEAVGVIGRNGAGKSTLFRLLCGITTPTEGRVQISRRFAALLALEAGFNPERTGRENIYLNAAIQGATPPQIKAAMSDIIDFAEIGRFIDLPVKRYSTGMSARLGFSIAIHLIPDIIFLDEILGVGDAAFQEKCYERIRGFKEQKRTLMVVSHTMDAVSRLCDRVIWMDQGRLKMDGPAKQVLKSYEMAFMKSPSKK